jgi:hypothetical protein
MEAFGDTVTKTGKEPDPNTPRIASTSRQPEKMLQKGRSRSGYKAILVLALLVPVHRFDILCIVGRSEVASRHRNMCGYGRAVSVVTVAKLLMQSNATYGQDMGPVTIQDAQTAMWINIRLLFSESRWMGLDFGRVGRG